MADHANEPASQLFAGLRFFVTQKIPSRSRFIEDIRANGGSVVKLESQADYLIADHARPGSPDGSISWKFIEDAIKNGSLPELESYMISSTTGHKRPAGSTSVGRKGTRTEYTDEEVRHMRRFVQRRTDQYRDGRGSGGNAIFQRYVELYDPEHRHSWQSWRDHFQKKYKNATPIKDDPEEARIDRMKEAAASSGGGSRPTTNSTIPSTAQPAIDRASVSLTSIPSASAPVRQATATPSMSAPRQATAIPSAPVQATTPSASTPVRRITEDPASREQSVSPEKTTTSRKPFTIEEDLGIYNFVCSKPPETRHGNTIYRVYAKDHPTHSDQAWRSRYVKVLEKRPPVGIDDASKSDDSGSDASSRRSHVPYTPEESLALWKFVREKGTNTRGEAIYKEWSRDHPQHSWGSWRNHYIHQLLKNPPVESTSHAVTTQVDGNHPAEDEHITRPTLPSEADRELEQTQSTESERENTPSTKESEHHGLRHPTQSPQKDYKLSTDQEALLSAVSSRKPRDSTGSYYTNLEISHLIVNIPDLSTKTLSDVRIEAWEEWTKVMQSRIAEDWKDLYNDHVLPEALRLQTAETSRKRKASTPLESPSKRPNTQEQGTEDQLQGSRVRREWTFAQATHKRKAEESDRRSPSETGSIARLTAANLAAQSARLARATTAPPGSAKPRSVETIARDGTAHVNDGDAPRAAQTKSPAPDRIQAEEASTKQSDVPEIVNASKPSQSDSQAKTSTSDLYTSSIPPRRPGDVGAVLQPQTQDATEATRRQSPSQATADDSIELDFSIPSPVKPAGAHDQQSKITSSQSHTAHHVEGSIDPPPGKRPSTLAQQTYHAPFVEDDYQEGAATPTAPRHQSPSSNSSTAFEVVPGQSSHRATFDELPGSLRTTDERTGQAAHRHNFDTQAVLDADTQLDFSMPEPPSSSPGLLWQQDDTTVPNPDQPASENDLEASLTMLDPDQPASEYNIEELFTMPDPDGAVPEDNAEVSFEDAEAFIAQYERDFPAHIFQDALYACSGRTRLAASILDSLREGRTYQPNAPWRWTAADDSKLLGRDAHELERLEQEHGTHEFDIRSRFLDEINASSQSS